MVAKRLPFSKTQIDFTIFLLARDIMCYLCLTYNIYLLFNSPAECLYQYQCHSPLFIFYIKM